MNQVTRDSWGGYLWRALKLTYFFLTDIARVRLLQARLETEMQKREFLNTQINDVRLKAERLIAEAREQRGLESPLREQVLRIA